MTEKYVPNLKELYEADEMLTDEEAGLSGRREDILTGADEVLASEADLKFTSLYGGNDPSIDDGIIEGTVRGHKVRLFCVISENGRGKSYSGVIDGIDVKEEAAPILFKTYAKIIREKNYLKNGDESLN